MKIDQETGEILPENTMPLTDKAPAIIIDVSEVATYHKEPIKLVEKINAQAGYMVFDVSTKKGRDACRAHAAQIIKCIAPACAESKRLADEAKKIVNQDLSFRKLFDAGVREIAEYHRKPLTEWEEEQARIAEQERIFAEKMEAARLYQIAHEEALELNELFDLRREKSARDAEAAALKQLQEQEEFERKLQSEAVERERERQARQAEIERQKAEQEKKRIAAQVEQDKRNTEMAHKQELERIQQENARKIEEERKKAHDDAMARIEEQNRLEREKQAKMLTIAEANQMLRNKNKTVTISEEEYIQLKSNNDLLHKIRELWNQSKRMSEAAIRAPNSTVMRQEQMEALRVRKQAIELIEKV